MDLISTFEKINKRNKMLQKKFKNGKKGKISAKNTMFIFDWDDTLFPTSWIDKNNRKTKRKNLKTLDKILCSFVNNMQKYGKIKIVTNASSSWVNKTLKYIPDTQNILKEYNINIFSAYDKYGKKYRTINWKKYAFRNIVRREMHGSLMNIFSIGDSEFEHYALLSLAHTNYKEKIMYLKSIKLSYRPSYKRIIKQLQYLNEVIPNEYIYDTHMSNPMAIIYEK